MRSRPIVVIAAALLVTGWPALAQEDESAGTSAIGVSTRGAPECSATIDVKVADFDAARQYVLDTTLEHGARLLHAQTMVNPKGKKHGWLRFRLAVTELPALLPELRRAGKLYSEHMTTADGASEYQEAERRVSQLQEHEKRLESLLTNSRRLRGSDILYIQDRLYRAGVEEVLLQQRRADLERGAKDSALQVELFEPGSLPLPPNRGPDLGRWFRDSYGLARAAFNRRLDRAATAGAYILVFAPLWLPAVIATLLVGWWAGRRLARILRRIRLHAGPALAGALDWLRARAVSGASRLTRIGIRRHPTPSPYNQDSGDEESHG